MTIQKQIGFSSLCGLDSAALDPSVLRNCFLEAFGGDESMFSVVVETFVAFWPTCKAEIRSGLEGQNRTAIERSGHQLKGAVSNFEAPAVYKLSALLEAEAQAADWHRVIAIVERLERHVQLLCETLEAAAGTCKRISAASTP